MEYARNLRSKFVCNLILNTYGVKVLRRPPVPTNFTHAAQHYAVQCCVDQLGAQLTKTGRHARRISLTLRATKVSSSCACETSVGFANHARLTNVMCRSAKRGLTHSRIAKSSTSNQACSRGYGQSALNATAFSRKVSS